MSEFNSDIEWVSDIEKEISHSDSETEIEIEDNDGNLGMHSTSASTSKEGSKTKFPRLKFSCTHTQLAITRYKEDVVTGLTYLTSLTKVTKSDLIRCLVSSMININDTSVVAIDGEDDICIQSIQSLQRSVNLFKLLNFRVSDSRKYKIKLEKLYEASNNDQNIVVAYAIENQLSTSLYMHLIVMTYLLLSGFDVRLVGALHPCSYHANDHKDILKKQSNNTKSKRKRETIISSSSSDNNVRCIINAVNNKSRKNIKKQTIYTHEDSASDSDSSKNNTDDDDDDDDDDGSRRECHIVPYVWLEVYLDMKTSVTGASDKNKNNHHHNHNNYYRWVHFDYVNNILDQPMMRSSTSIPTHNANSISTSSSNMYDNPNNTTRFKSVSHVVSVEFDDQDNRMNGVSVCSSVTPNASDCQFHYTDVTSRYCTQYHHVCNKYRCYDESKYIDFLTSFIQTHNDKNTNNRCCNYLQNRREKDENDLRQLVITQTNMPTSFAAFKGHPVYVLERHLAKNEIPMLSLDHSKHTDTVATTLDSELTDTVNTNIASVSTNTSSSNTSNTTTTSNNTNTDKVVKITKERLVHSYFQGEKVYLRRNIKQLFSRRDWFKQLRKVKKEYLEQPFKIITKASVHKYNSNSNGNNINDKSCIELKLYAYEQTESYNIPSVMTDGVIPVNSYGNIEIWDRNEKLVPQGCVFIQHNHAIEIATQLCVYHAPALIGFETKRRYNNNTSSSHITTGDMKIPLFGGVVVLTRDEQIMREALSNYDEHKENIRCKQISENAIKKWKNVIIKLMSRNRLKLTYGH